ncbi:hypothetical protein [Streptomyces niveus]|uniref:hypothetical protein n=1 Tax=Streptomyces niveus TaxID=193462 RepID=UPI00342BE40A
MDETVRDLIAASPCGFENRTQALHQILVVLGAGYEWRDGQAVDRFNDGADCTRRHERFRFSTDLIEELLADGVDVPEPFLTGKCPAEDQRERAAEVALTAGPLGRDPYPPTSGLLLLTVPENVTPDWAAAAAEIRAVVRPLWHDQGLLTGEREADLTVRQRQFVSEEHHKH